MSAQRDNAFLETNILKVVALGHSKGNIHASFDETPRYS
jgi:hypothetical protein